MLFSISIITLIVLLIIACVIFILFKSNTPKTFRELLFEIEHIWYGVVSNVEDNVLGICYNKVSLDKHTSSVAVLTGGNRGLGLHILKKLLQCEMTVILGVRNIDAAKKSVESHIDTSLLMNRVIYETCDTGDIMSVRNFAKRVQTRCHAINLLINNAGIMGIPYSTTKDGYETQMGVNYIGHFLLTHLLMPQLINGSKESHKTSRIVNVSSCAHYGGRINYDDFNASSYYYTGMAYADSKLAQVMFTRYLHKICVENNWKVQPYSCHPGIVNTEIFQNSLIGSLDWLRKIIMKTPEQGSRSIIYTAIAPEIESNGGIFISNCRPSRISKIARNYAECRKFFTFTCDLLNIKNFGIE